MASPLNKRLALTEFVTQLRHGLSDHVVDVRLFGSEARGDATPESDIDVLVVVQPESDRAALEDRVIDIACDVNVASGSTGGLRLASRHHTRDAEPSRVA